MDNIIETIVKGKKKIIKFNKEAIYTFLKTQFGFRYSKIENRNYFLQIEGKNIFKVDVDYIINTFTKYLMQTYQQKHSIDDSIMDEILNEYYKNIPIKNNNLLKNILNDGFKLTDEEIHFFKLNYLISYKRKFLRKEMIKFLNYEGFKQLKTEEIKRFNSFDEKCPLYYKQVGSKFLIFEFPGCKYKDNIDIVDFSSVKAKSLKEFLKGNYFDLKFLVTAFKLKEDIKAYNYEINNY